MKVLALLLAASDLSGALAEYLRAAPGSEAEKAAFSEVSTYFEADSAMVEDAIRNHLPFPAAEPGLRLERIRLVGLEHDAEAPGTNEVAVWVPRGYDPAKRWPVMMVIHGSSGLADMDVGGLGRFADEHGLLLIGPQDELKRHGGGWGFTDYEHALHLQALRWLKRSYNVDDSRVFVFGGSRGGHASWDLATTYPDLFAGAIPVVGGPPRNLFRMIKNLRHVPILDMQGARDQAALIENVHDAIAELRKLGYDVTYKEDPDAGHFYPIDWDEVWKWMEKRRRPSYPKDVLLTAIRDDRSGAYWLEMTGLDREKFEKPPPTVNRTGEALTRKEAIELIRKNYEKYSAKVEGRIDDNRIDLTVKQVPKLTLRLHPDLVDFAEKVDIRINGRPRVKLTVTPSLETLLSTLKTTADRDRLVYATVNIRGGR